MAARSWLLVVHAGAGEHSTAAERERIYCNAMRTACVAGREALLHGGDAMRACVAAVAAMEDDPACNAGLGSNLTEDGTVECDASVMDGSVATFGACGAVSGVRNPVRLAEALLVRQGSGERLLGRVHPMVLAGWGARTWAQTHGVHVVEPASLVTPHAKASWRQYMKWLREEEEEEASSSAAGEAADLGQGVSPKRRRLDVQSSSTPPVDSVAAAGGVNSSLLNDTVGAVCCDGLHCAAAVSSGGVWLKHSGRVGEAAAFGAGCWASDGSQGDGDGVNGGGGVSVAASVSGVGEQVMRSLLAQAACNVLRASQDWDDVGAMLTPTAAADGRRESGPSAGIIALRCGEAGAAEGGSAASRPRIELIVAHSAPSFAVGYAHHQQPTPTAFISRRAPGSVSASGPTSVFATLISQ